MRSRTRCSAPRPHPASRSSICALCWPGGPSRWASVRYRYRPSARAATVTGSSPIARRVAGTVGCSRIWASPGRSCAPRVLATDLLRGEHGQTSQAPARSGAGCGACPLSVGAARVRFGLRHGGGVWRAPQQHHAVEARRDVAGERRAPRGARRRRHAADRLSGAGEHPQVAAGVQRAPRPPPAAGDVAAGAAVRSHRCDREGKAGRLRLMELVLWRAFPWDPLAQAGAPFSASYIPERQGGGRFDLEHSLVVYLAESPEHAVAEKIQGYRGQELAEPDLGRAGRRLAVASARLGASARVGITDLCDPDELARRRLRPDTIASRDIQRTHAIAEALYEDGKTGLRG